MKYRPSLTLLFAEISGPYCDGRWTPPRIVSAFPRERGSSQDRHLSYTASSLGMKGLGTRFVLSNWARSLAPSSQDRQTNTKFSRALQYSGTGGAGGRKGGWIC